MCQGRFALLLELPRHCEYWSDPRVQQVLNDGKCEVHELDGCMYGLVGRNKKPIKKPWKMLTWNLPVGNGLGRKCDGSHEHTPCAGSDTKSTQLYTPLVVKLIVDSLALRNHRDVRVGDSARVGVKKKAKALCCVMPYWSHDDDTSDEDVTRPEGPSVDTVAQPRDSTRSHVDLVEVVLSCRVGYIFEGSKGPADFGWSGRRSFNQGEWCGRRPTMSRVSIALGGGILAPWQTRIVHAYNSLSRSISESPDGGSHVPSLGSAWKRSVSGSRREYWHLGGTHHR